MPITTKEPTALPLSPLLASVKQSAKKSWFSRFAGLTAPLAFLVSLILLTAVLGIRFYNEPQLAVGSRVDRTIVAPQTVEVIDWEATQTAQSEARLQAVQVFTLEPDTEQLVNKHLNDLLIEGQQIFSTAGAFPFVSTGTLPSESQHYLRNISQSDWLDIKQLISDPSRNLAGSNAMDRAIITQLRGADPELLPRIDRARFAYSQAITRSKTAPTVYQTRLLELSPPQWAAVETQTREVTHRLLAIGVSPGLPEKLRKQGILAQLPPDLTATERGLIVDLVKSVLQSNLRVDRLETFRQAEQAARNITPISIQLTQGQVLLRKEDIVTPRWFEILDQLDLTQRGVNWQELGILVLLEILALRVFLWWKEHSGKCCNLRKQDMALTLLLVLSTAGIGVLLGPTWSFFLPFVAVGLLLGSFYGSPRGLAVLLTLAVPFWYGLKLPLTTFLPVLAGGVVAALLVGRLRAREEMALLGFLAAIVQGSTFAILSILFTQDYNWRDLLFQASQMVGGGVVSSILALGASPYLERLFDVITPVRLSELANPNRPLLKRLATEAPGTFQHTLFVANLAEAAAQSLGDNAELVRAGTLYHDIGKMLRPRYFIENQMGMPNPHSQLDDPWRSAEIIRAHVSDGLKLARKYGLPKVIRDFIPEHQGTIQIAYFYHQAVERVGIEGVEGVKDEDFRYPGPNPRSRETGLVMLADACEAALRSLQETTETEAIAMVQRILAARWREGHLKDSGILDEELPQISRVFVKVWREQNHQRIRYPSPPACAVPPEKLGVTPYR
ncbi:MAG: HDIG domain-containing protein [Anaerolineae bacterium]|nr:HDIG domain-containing protein [Gloeobacterales cyanobacterium ES-bin-313]